jgi:hypothetical protein
MRKQSAAVIACTSLSAAFALLPSSPAIAAPAARGCTTVITSSKMTPPTIKVASTGISKGFFEMTAHDSCDDISIDTTADFYDGIRDTPISVESFNGYPYYGPNDDYYAYGNAYFDPNDLDNEEATTWTTLLTAEGSASDLVDGVSFHLVRTSYLTANAAPEPVKKGKTVKVTGKLTRANWDAGHDSVLGQQPVQLQFRTKSGSWATVKTVTSSSAGKVKASTTATKDGYFRFVFAGLTSTAAVKSSADHVNVT